MKKINSGSAPSTHPHRRPPSTPPLPLRTLQLVARQQDTPVVLREHRRVRGHPVGVRESWPCTGVTGATGLSRVSRVSGVSGVTGVTKCDPQTTRTVLQSGRGSDATMMSLLLFCHSSNNSLVAIDNKIEQAMDLVKSHLMMAVREEVELLRERIRELQEKNTQLERENHILRTITHTH